MVFDKMLAIIYTDGASSGNPGNSGIGAVISYGSSVFEISEYIGLTTNNVAEYKALIAALKKVNEINKSYDVKINEVEIKMDSELVVKQINGLYRVKMPHLQPLYNEAVSLLSGFDKYKVSYISRTINVKADALARKASKSRAG